MKPMNKFIKRISKSKKNIRNILVVGTGWEKLSNLCDVYPSVFIISTGPQDFRRKNLIYKESFDQIETLPDIDAIVMDRDQEVHVSKLLPLLNKYQSVILVQGVELFAKTEYKFLKTYGYAVTEMFGDSHLWKKINEKLQS
jgi:hypothetical protein